MRVRLAMEIRRIVAEDERAYVELYAAVAAEGRWIAAEAPIDPIGIGGRVRLAMERDDIELLVADDEGSIVGSIGLVLEGGVVELGMLVDRTHRGRGVGRRLLEAGVDWARTVGAHKMSLEVWPHNERALHLYRRAGFEVEGRRRRHHRRSNGELWDAIVMGLVLDLDAPGSSLSDLG